MAEVTGFPNPPRLIDSTLRDGEQAPGVAFSRNEKVIISCLLDQLGLTELEVGIPAMGSEEVDLIREIASLELNCKLTGWCRARRDDIDRAAQAGLERVHLSFPVSESHLGAIGKDRKWLFSSLKPLIEYARESFGFIAVGALDGSRTDRIVLEDFACMAFEYGADRLRIADTVGILNPMQTWELIHGLHELIPDLELEFHGHNDLGMATANTISALSAGAGSASVTVNGLGERAGNAPLEEVAMAMQITLKMDPGIRTVNLAGVCSKVARFAGRPIPAAKPLTGAMVFTHESGIHCHGLLKDPHTYQPFLPEQIGRTGSRLVIGKHSGSAVLRHLLKEEGIERNDDEIAVLLQRVRSLAMVKKGSLSMDELRMLL
ncbi:MAG TPA: homocitrate synthase [Bacillota bacterium]